MKISIFRFPFLFGGHVAAAACLLGFLPSLVAAPGRKYPPTNAAGMPVVDTNGKRINYIHEFVAAISPASKDATRTSVKGQTTSTGASSRFVAATASTARPFWQYAILVLVSARAISSLVRPLQEEALPKSSSAATHGMVSARMISGR